MQQCSSAGMVCRNTDVNTHGCCCNKTKLFSPSEARCFMDEACNLRCVEPVFHSGRPVFPKMCNVGTFCKLSTQGKRKNCGTTLRPVKKMSKKHGQCCVDPDLSSDEQTRKGCCNHGVGIDCTDRRKRPCCLDVTNSHDHDPLDWCQRNCTGPEAQLITLAVSEPRVEWLF